MRPWRPLAAPNKLDRMRPDHTTGWRAFALACALTGTACARARDSDAPFVREHYTKSEYQIPVRDGVKLFTIVYAPKDASDTNRYPILLKRTPFSIAPYGSAAYAG